MSDGSKEEKLRQIFRIFDKDGSGSITQGEMEGIVTNLCHLIQDKEKEEAASPEELAQRIMNETDRNKVVHSTAASISAVGRDDIRGGADVSLPEAGAAHHL